MAKLLKEFPYLYETHMHTEEASRCGKVSGAEMARAAKEYGYSGVFITDHHWGGNTRPDRELPWEEWVDEFCSGYEAAKRVGDEIGLSVFMGWEAGFRGTEFLIYGLDKAWMKAHPELRTVSVEEQYQLIREAGGMVIQAHPFREEPYIPEIRLFPEWVDGVEIINAQHSNPGGNRPHPEYDRKAREYAAKYGLPGTAGSDMHRAELLGGGVAFKEKLNSVQDFIRKIKSGKGYVITDGVRWYNPQGDLLGEEN